MKRRHALDDPTVGARVLSARQRRGISQRQLVAETPYTAAYVSRIEAGERTPSLAFLRSIAPALDVQAVWLETGYDDVDVRMPRRLAEQLLDEGALGPTDEMHAALMGALSLALRVEPEYVLGLA